MRCLRTNASRDPSLTEMDPDPDPALIAPALHSPLAVAEKDERELAARTRAHWDTERIT